MGRMNFGFKPKTGKGSVPMTTSHKFSPEYGGKFGRAVMVNKGGFAKKPRAVVKDGFSGTGRKIVKGKNAA